MRRLLFSITVILSTVIAATTPAAVRRTGPGGGGSEPGSVTVDGAVSMPHSYSAAALAALPTETVPVTLPTPFGPWTVAITGVSLDALVTGAAPILPAVKNASLRAIITVTGAFGRAVTFASGELDPKFGNHDAVVATRVGGFALGDDATLVVPGDTSLARVVPAVHEVTVAVANPQAIPPPTGGGIDVEVGHHTVVLSAAVLASLPEQTRTVSFLAGSGSHTHVEQGPSLADVLRAAGVDSGPTTSVAAVGSPAPTGRRWRCGGRPLCLRRGRSGDRHRPRTAAGDRRGAVGSQLRRAA